MIYRDVPLTDLPAQHYSVALIDPPWRFLARSDKGYGKSADQHYRTMTIDGIKALPVKHVMRPNSVVFMWIIDSHVQLGLDVLAAWGFEYKTVGLYWAKTGKDGKFPIGMGFWTRANPEHAYEAWTGDDQEVERLFLATKGGPKRQAGDVPRLMVEPRREHSRKPDETYNRIERLLPGPYLEMFSRNDRPGWDCWGDEAGSFQQRKTKLKLKLPPDLAAVI